MKSSGIAKKISREQREAMLKFMLENPDLAKNRLSGPQGVITKSMKWEELAGILNSCPTGVCKTPDKWSRSWQDWKSDVIQKASRLRRHAAITGGGHSKATPLTALEDRLLSFIRETALSGVTGVIDPLEISTESADGMSEFALTEEEGANLIETPAPSTPASGITPPTVRRASEHDEDEYVARSIQASERMADAMERVASGMEMIANFTKETEVMVRALAVSMIDLQEVVMTLAGTVTEALDRNPN